MALLPLPPICSLSVVLILLLISIHGTSSAVNFKSCASSSSCGIFSVKYPFSLYDPYTSTTNSSYCGYPGLLLYCDTYGNLILFLSSYNYTVKSMSYTTKTISLVETEVLLQSTSTFIPNHNVSVTPNVWLNYTDQVVNLTFFLNCTQLNSNYSLDLINPTAGGNICRKYSYVFGFYCGYFDYDDSYEFLKSCEEVVTVPVLGLEVDSTSLPTTYNSTMLKGFELVWGAHSDYCTQCENRGCHCGYNVATNSTYNLNCYCLGAGDIKKSHFSLGVVSAIGACIITGLLALCIGFLYYASKNKKVCFGTEERKSEKLVQVTLENFGSLSPKRYTFSEIKRITKSFNQKVGQGGYASVFKGELMDRTPVAVKVFKDRESSGEEFISEVVSIARTSHVNIVRLLGFFIKGSKRALIYEFMPNGSLDKYLRESQNSTLSHMECTKLFEIAIGTAQGLEYLHQGCNTRIVHFDIKPHNILLDQEYCPKISDFGLAKFCQPTESILSMSGLRGTIGYIAPEVFSRNFGAVSSKSDVYSYGMMVLEMFGGKQGKMELIDSSSDIYFPDYIHKCVEQHNICSVYGISDVSEEIVRKVTIVGLWCIQVMPHARPTMSMVLDMLDKSIEELALPSPLSVSLTPALVQEATNFKTSTLSSRNGIMEEP